VGSTSVALTLGTLVALAPAQAAPRVASAVEFDAPSGLAVGGGHLWVTNEANDSVTEINPSNGAWVGSFTRAEGYRFSQPVAITRNRAELFVANGGGSVTEMAALNGKLLRVIQGAKFHFADPVAIASSGNMLLVLNGGGSNPGSITEVNARTGSLVRVISGSSFAFDEPVAMSVAGTDVFVADEADNSVTEVNAVNGSLVRVVPGEGLDAPDGIAVQNGNVWVADSASNAVTEINSTTGAAISTYSDAGGPYGFGQPSAVIGVQGNVYVMTPFGTSPMVTKVNATTGAPAWFMCNTNGPYYFSLLSAFAVSGDDLWVASRSGANSQTPGAATGSLTEMLITTGALIATVPAPSTTTTTTSTTTTTTPWGRARQFSRAIFSSAGSAASMV
jgi:outer membrane protein assembly factor BamB